MKNKISILSCFTLSLLLCGSAHAQATTSTAGAVVGGIAAAGGVAAGIFSVPLGGNFQGSATVQQAPEISGSDTGGLMLLLGGIAVLRGRRRTTKSSTR